MEEYNLQVWDSKDDHNKQWAAVRQLRLQRLLLRPRHQKPVLILRHPQANGQTKVTNRTLLKIIKTKIDDVKGAWLEELPNVLWAYRTTVRTPTGETPFRLTYGTEAIIPIKVGVTSIRREVLCEENNVDQLRINLDCLDEIRDEAYNRMTI